MYITCVVVCSRFSFSFFRFSEQRPTYVLPISCLYPLTKPLKRANEDWNAISALPLLQQLLAVRGKVAFPISCGFVCVFLTFPSFQAEFILYTRCKCSHIVKTHRLSTWSNDVKRYINGFEANYFLILSRAVWAGKHLLRFLFFHHLPSKLNCFPCCGNCIYYANFFHLTRTVFSKYYRIVAFFRIESNSQKVTVSRKKIWKFQVCDLFANQSDFVIQFLWI